MAWFQRSKDVEPTSLEQYYADQQHRGASAWLMAIAAFLLTLILVFGVFWGGRWVYRKATHKDKTVVATAPAQAGDPFATANIQTPTSSDDKSKGVVNAPTNSSSSSSSANTSNPQSAAATPPATSTTPSTPTQPKQPASNTQQLVNTGPGSQLAIFLAVTVAATLLYQLKLRYSDSRSNSYR